MKKREICVLVAALVVVIGSVIAVYPAKSEASGSNSVTSVTPPPNTGVGDTPPTTYPEIHKNCGEVGEGWCSNEVTSTTYAKDSAPFPTLPTDNRPCNPNPDFSDCNDQVLTPYTQVLPARDWVNVGFAWKEPLTIEQVVPGMAVCTVNLNGPSPRDLIVREVIDFQPTNSELERAFQESTSSFYLVVESTAMMATPDGSEKVALLTLELSNNLGLTGTYDFVRTFAGNCKHRTQATVVRV